MERERGASLGAATEALLVTISDLSTTGIKNVSQLRYGLAEGIEPVVRNGKAASPESPTPGTTEMQAYTSAETQRR